MNQSTSSDIFLFVFRELKFPFFSIDSRTLSDVLRENQEKKPNSYIRLPLTEFVEKKEYLINSFRGIFQGIEVPEEIIKEFERSPYFSEFLKNGKGLKEIVESDYPFFSISSKEELVWEEGTYWPCAYNVIIHQLFQLVRVFRRAVIERKKHFQDQGINIDILAEYPRMMPTSIHYAFASLGEWLGGSSNMQYFGCYAVKPQIRDEQINLDYLKRIEYLTQHAEALNSSGIIGLPASLMLPLLEAQEDGLYIGSLPIDEWNAINLPTEETYKLSPSELIEKEKLPGFLIDKYYRTPFRARIPNNQGLLGTKNILRDHYEEFYSNLGEKSLIRCKHYCAPIIEVSSFKEIQEIISRIPLRSDEGLFYRGQTTFYSIKRDPLIKGMLFANSCNLEPSLITAAARTNFDYDQLHFGLKYFVQEYLDYHESFKKSTNSKAFAEAQKSATLEVDHAIMALAQHYGIPSHGLDITKNPDIALWFATNKYSFNQGKATYSKMREADWNKSSDKWPVIFVLQTVTHTIQPSLHNCHELSDFGINALRPTRQEAKFFLGGHSEHQNRLAEAVVCMFRLKPADYDTSVDFDYLFPPPSEDNAYQLMLEFSNKELFSEFGSDKVNRFHV